jgi:3-oxoacyl-[acyl-carrier protein] reductase
VDLGLAGKRVLVTGGTGGIGRAIVQAFFAEDARVALTYCSSADAAQSLLASLGGSARRPGRAMAVRYDLADPVSISSAVAEVAGAWGGIDVLVTAAVQWSAFGPFLAQRFDEAPEQAWLPLLRVNLEGHIRTAQLVMPGMRSRQWGRIALLSSYHATEGTRGSEFYGAAKAGLHGFMRGLAWDAGADGVLVNVVAPGLTLTEQIRARVAPDRLGGEAARSPSGRLSTPEDVAKVVTFVCSDANGNLTGEIVPVTGGY